MLDCYKRGKVWNCIYSETPVGFVFKGPFFVVLAEAPCKYCIIFPILVFFNLMIYLHFTHEI